MAELNVIIPMGGIGSRFTKEGYRFPKPLIKIVGRPMVFWLLDNLHFRAGDILWLALDRDIEKTFEIYSAIKREYSSLDVRYVPLRFQTRGAAETLFCILQQMDSQELKRKTISLDCDTIYFSDVLTSFRELKHTGACYYFEDTGPSPTFSYIQLDEGKRIVDIAEKERISSHANTGAYAFQSAELLKAYLERLLDEPVFKSGEYYTSNVIGTMVKDGERFEGVFVEDFSVVGTPAQLEDFLCNIRSGKVQTRHKLRICFDLDNTLVTAPLVTGDYTTVKPLTGNIQIVRELYNAGHTIIIYTARRMKTHSGNVGRILADVGDVTFQTLREFQIPFHEIYFGKPYAHLYVDDLAVNGLVDTAREIGWYECKPSQDVPKDVVKPRDFNTVVFVNDTVVKSSPREDFRGEIYFYQNMPSRIKHFFPDLISVNLEAEIPCITLSRVRGVTFSFLLLNRCLTKGRLERLLQSVAQIQELVPKSDPAADTNVYANYCDKMTHRFQNHRAKYELIAEESPLIQAYNFISSRLREYQAKDRARRSRIIHGDPVFSNVLLTSNSALKLLDMRGILGDTCTLEGDALYDYGKILQSLYGYDHVLLDEEVDDAYISHLRDSVFWPFVLKSFLPQDSSLSNFMQLRVDLLVICASLYFSLIPYHTVQVGQRCFNICQKVIKEIESQELPRVN